LSAIHRNGWIHGDIRLANLAQDAAARVSVFDFNRAKPNDHSNAALAAEELAHALVLLKGIPTDDSGYGYSF
jgi:serine/threonine protein kinase